MKIKVCGMRDALNIRAIEALGIDMMGFICWPKSCRNVTERPSYLPQCERVGVFVNPTIEYVEQMVHMFQLSRIQLHGHESKIFCREVHQRTKLPITKAIQVANEQDMDNWREYASEAAIDLLLFDTKCHTAGGSGEQFDWRLLQMYDGHKPFMLAGGIGPGCESQVLAFHHPKCIGIDLNSRFETTPALKDVSKLQTFINNIKAKSQDAI
ncbi:MAG: phosphoribosylanthranilate isomerase [Bacteroidaceae bacterium]|nr:phosphoribosylanthranilate isomerase [Bacteroidaceae bacterium]